MASQLSRRQLLEAAAAVAKSADAQSRPNILFIMADEYRPDALGCAGNAAVNNLPCELFDVEKDPEEMHNLVNEPSHAGIRKVMHRDYVLPFMNS